MSKVTLEELNRLAADPEADLSPYFIHDEARSGPFNPEMRLNPQTVDIPPDLGPTRSAGLVNAGNWLERRRRAGRYYAMIAKGYNGPLVVAEGDSWWQYPFLLRDTIDWLSDSCAIFCVSAAGDLLEDMARKREYLDAVAETGAGILLLSGGGNDLVAGGSLQDYLEDYDVDLKPTDYLKPSFPDLLDRAFGYYERIFTEVRNAFPHVHIICHGYDYPIPAAGKWLGKPMAKRNILNPKLQRQIAVHMVDIFNIGLRRVVRRVPGVTYLDLRGTVGDHQWHDELHPSNEGYRLVAKKFAREINKAANREVDPVRSIAGPFAVSAETETNAGIMAAPAQTGKAVKTRSLHLGLNFVNPATYSGWDGALRACVNDAQAMAGLAQAQGFDAQTLIDQEATHDAVVAAVKAAATELREGDMFLWSVSCHGMQVRDYNRDETDDGDQPMDEALALWDMPLVDDNIYRLWSSFAPGVRILMIPDTCHSGTMTRRAFLSPEEAEALIRPRSAPKIILEPVQFRFMPDQVQARVLAENDARYRDHAREYHDFGEAATLRLSIPPVTASVVSISACQDNQLAQDGTQHGAFTGALLKVWSNGRFQGTYSEFHRQISETMANPDQLPKLYETGAKDLAFLVQRPFSPAGSAATAAGARPHTAPASASPHQMTESPADVLIATEGNENDPLDGVDPRDMVAGTGTRWAARAEFDRFIGALGLHHLKPAEFLVLGAAHVRPGAPGFGLNSPPPQGLWPNIVNTARMVDELRRRIGGAVTISNAYRSSAYNAAVGGARSSQHLRFNALDITSPSATPRKLAEELLGMRDRERLFSGGIGLYDSFVHIDTRGHDATWGDLQPGTGRTRSRDDRRQTVAAMNLGRTRSQAAKTRSAFRDPPLVPAGSIDPELALEQQRLGAAVAGSGVVSFVNNLTPQQKEDVLLSLLFAQRAADAAVDPIADIEAWFEKYLEILTLLGWVTEARPKLRQEQLHNNASFDTAILQMLASVATGNQFTVIQAALNGLKALGSESPTIRLFDLSSTVAEGGHFQVGAAEAAGEVVSLALGAFHHRVRDSRKNVLFISWGESSIDYWISAGKLTLIPGLYSEIRDVVQKQLGQDRRSHLADIPLG